MKKKISGFVSRNFPGAWKRYMRVKKRLKFGGKSREEVFSHIYKTNMWSSEESVSGAGSTMLETENLRKEMASLIERHGIRSMADVPCGDFNWMRHLVHVFDHYHGGDIVEDLVKANQEKYGSEKVSFSKMDLTQSKLPDADVLMVRDCLVHLAYADIRAALDNISKSNIKWLLTTHFVDVENHDITTGDWRPINLCAPPFSLPQPIESIKDSQINDRKTLSLWRVDELRRSTRS